MRIINSKEKGMSPWSKTIKIVCARPGGDINEVKREKKTGRKI